MRRFFILALLFISACSRSAGDPSNISYPDTGPAYGDAIVSGSIGDASTFVPIVASDSASHAICGLVFNGLVKYDKDINIVGELAQKWEVSEDKLTITFHLRKGVRWHDGHPFTAEDVEFTYQKLVDPNVRTPYSGDFERVESVEVVDDYTVRVMYKEPFSPGLSSWGMSIIPKHLLSDEDLNSTDLGRNPVGTGPYKFKRWLTGERIDLVSNHDYFEGRPFIDKYIYRIIPDQDTMFLELQARGLDYTGLTPLQYSRQTDTPWFEKHFAKYKYPSFGYTYMGYNLKDPKFSDKRVRQAINHAIDKDEVIEGVLYGLGRVCTGPYPPESWAYNKNVLPAGYNPNKAKQLLAEAGWFDTDGDGWLDKDRQPFEFTIITNQGNNQRKLTAEIIQRRLAKVGIRVKIKIVEWAAFLAEFIDKRKFEAIILGWGLGRDPDGYDLWHSSKTKEREFNFVSYANDEVDQLLIEGRREFDQEKRKVIYNRIHEILYDEQPYCFLYVPDSLPVVHARFKGIKPAPLGIGYNFIEWYVPEEQQRYTR